MCCVNSASGLYIVWGILHAYSEIVHLALIHILVLCVSSKEEQVTEGKWVGGNPEHVL